MRTGRPVVVLTSVLLARVMLPVVFTLLFSSLFWSGIAASQEKDPETMSVQELGKLHDQTSARIEELTNRIDDPDALEALDLSRRQLHYYEELIIRKGGTVPKPPKKGSGVPPAPENAWEYMPMHESVPQNNRYREVQDDIRRLLLEKRESWTAQEALVWRGTLDARVEELIQLEQQAAEASAGPLTAEESRIRSQMEALEPEISRRTETYNAITAEFDEATQMIEKANASRGTDPDAIAAGAIGSAAAWYQKQKEIQPRLAAAEREFFAVRTRWEALEAKYEALRLPRGAKAINDSLDSSGTDGRDFRLHEKFGDAEFRGLLSPDEIRVYEQNGASRGRAIRNARLNQKVGMGSDGWGDAIDTYVGYNVSDQTSAGDTVADIILEPVKRTIAYLGAGLDPYEFIRTHGLAGARVLNIPRGLELTGIGSVISFPMTSANQSAGNDACALGGIGCESDHCQEILVPAGDTQDDFDVSELDDLQPQYTEDELREAEEIDELRRNRDVFPEDDEESTGQAANDGTGNEYNTVNIPNGNWVVIAGSGWVKSETPIIGLDTGVVSSQPNALTHLELLQSMRDNLAGYVHYLQLANDAHFAQFQSQVEQGIITTDNMARAQTALAWQQFFHNWSNAINDVAGLGDFLSGIAENPESLQNLTFEELVNNLSKFDGAIKTLESGSTTLASGLLEGQPVPKVYSTLTPDAMGLTGDDINKLKSYSTTFAGMISDTRSLMNNGKSLGQALKEPGKVRQALLGLAHGLLSDYSQGLIQERQERIAGLNRDLVASDLAQSGAFTNYVEIRSLRFGTEDALAAANETLDGALTDYNQQWGPYSLTPTDVPDFVQTSPDGTIQIDSWGSALEYFPDRIADIGKDIDKNIGDNMQPGGIPTSIDTTAKSGDPDNLLTEAGAAAPDMTSSKEPSTTDDGDVVTSILQIASVKGHVRTGAGEAMVSTTIVMFPVDPTVESVVDNDDSNDREWDSGALVTTQPDGDGNYTVNINGAH